MQTKNRAVIGILLMVFLFFIILMVFATYTVKVFNDESKVFDTQNKKGQIAVVEVSGPIMSAKNTVELLERAEKDKSVKAIILRINSPGGAVGPTQEIYEEIRRIDSAYNPEDKESKGKPIYASFDAIAASGGYYLGAATRRIYASAGTLTGSIGVIMNFTDLSRLYEFIKVKATPVKAGKYKDIGSPHRGMTTEESDIMNRMIKVVHRQFMGAIEETRKDKLKKDIIELAQGQIFSGEEARDLGLVDELGGLWTAGRAIHKELNLEGEFALKYIKKKKKSGLWDLVDNLDQATSNIRLSTMVDYMPMLIFGK
ncbi:signal peptide peptidase SppA [Halobacteriovorax sp. JY17]|uniref:signal peptide peptidase SppA n=1 Tax=Halobacteriovorax sp. JY17 TaxID=2014617 RepID=UPI000C516E1E|nr:signal peptide peptidase SppA [Halobacteriovorax sp. JY17]PIK16499.1 MAG: signal peptide peptidase SppA [Halobacteriovorax sp. JY17]